MQGGVVLRPSTRGPNAKGIAPRGSNGVGTAPYGFMFHQSKLIVNPKELSTVRKIILLWTKGFNSSDIARQINELKIETRKGSKWDHSLIRRIIKRHKDSDELYRKALT